MSKEWLLDSIALETFELDVESYALKDPTGERAFGFVLSESLSRARSFTPDKGLFVGMTFKISETCTPSPSILAQLILECKGKILVDAIEKEQYHITNAKEKDNEADRMPDWVLQSVLQQKLLQQ